MGNTSRIYAEKTKVTVSNSKIHIEALVRKHGSNDIGIMEFGGRVGVMFRLEGRNIRFSAPIPDNEQARKALYRGFLLTIKAKLESAKAGIETFEEAFMSQIILPTGRTVAEEVAPKIAQAYETKSDVPLLGGWS